MTGNIAARRALVFQHLDVEHPGSLGHLLRANGVELVAIELDEGEPIPTLQDFDLLVVMGGPMNVWEEEAHPWLVAEKAAIRSWVNELRRPYLGVCLGHQLLADALGGAVALMAEPEIGVTRMNLTPAAATDSLFAGMKTPIEGVQWHSCEVTALPPGATALAGNDSCAIQAFRVEPYAWGVQFHVEVSGSTVAEWAEIPQYRTALEDCGRSVEWLASSVAEHLEDLELNARLVGEHLLSVIDVTKGTPNPSGTDMAECHPTAISAQLL